jgi:hypothetical protein
VFEWFTQIDLPSFNFATMEVIDSGHQDSRFFVKLQLKFETFAGPYKRPQEWHQLKAKTVLDAGFHGFRMIKTDCLDPKTGNEFTPRSQHRGRKVFVRGAENLLDYIRQLQSQQISFAAHEAVWRQVLTPNLRFLNHNKDVDKLHFKFEQKQLFSTPAPWLCTESAPSAPLSVPQMSRSRTATVMTMEAVVPTRRSRSSGAAAVAAPVESSDHESPPRQTTFAPRQASLGGEGGGDRNVDQAGEFHVSAELAAALETAAADQAVRARTEGVDSAARSLFRSFFDLDLE